MYSEYDGFPPWAYGGQRRPVVEYECQWCGDTQSWASSRYRVYCERCGNEDSLPEVGESDNGECAVERVYAIDQADVKIDEKLFRITSAEMDVLRVKTRLRGISWVDLGATTTRLKKRRWPTRKVKPVAFGWP